MGFRTIEALLCAGGALTACAPPPAETFTMGQFDAGITGPGLATAEATYFAPATETAQANEQQAAATQTAVWADFEEKEPGASDSCVQVQEGDTIWTLQKQGYAGDKHIFVCQKPGTECDRYPADQPPNNLKVGEYVCESKISSFHPGNPHRSGSSVPVRIHR